MPRQKEWRFLLLRMRQYNLKFKILSFETKLVSVQTANISIGQRSKNINYGDNFIVNKALKFRETIKVDADLSVP